MKKRITIFCQGPADVIYVLNLYKEHKNNASISIFCINVKSIYDYISSLNLNLEVLVFIPNNFNVSIKYPFSSILARKKLNSLNTKYFKHKRNEIIYFFGIWYDWITSYFLKVLAINNSIIYYQHYSSVPEVGRKRYKLKERYILLQYFLITGIRFQFTEKEKILRLLFPYKEYNIKKQKAEKVNLELLKPYLFKKKNVSEKSILLFESNLACANYIINYEDTILKILDKLKKCGYSVYIKGHPRLGISKCINTLHYSILPQEIPAELIDVSVFNHIIGIISVSIAFLSKYHQGVFSLMNLFEFYDNSIKNSFIAYLKENSNNKINFIKNIDDLCLLKD